MDQQALSSSHNFLHTFCVNPTARFETQGKDEKILLILRAHPITQLYWIFNAFIFLLLLIFVNFAVANLFSPAEKTVLNIFAIVFIASYLWFSFLAYFFNVGIVTNERVIDIDFHAIIYREITEAKLNKIEDLTAKSSGYFASVFNYGDIFIQTAGAQENIEFLKVPNPSKVVEVIGDM